MDELEADLQERKFPIGIFALGLTLLLIGLGFVFIVTVKPFSKAPADAEVERRRAARGPLETYDHPLLSSQQQSFLQSIGFDVRDFPEELTPEQEACLIGAVGAEHYKEVLAGGELTVADFYKGKGCF